MERQMAKFHYNVVEQTWGPGPHLRLRLRPVGSRARRWAGPPLAPVFHVTQNVSPGCAAARRACGSDASILNSSTRCLRVTAQTDASAQTA